MNRCNSLSFVWYDITFLNSNTRSQGTNAFRILSGKWFGAQNFITQSIKQVWGQVKVGKDTNFLSPPYFSLEAYGELCFKKTKEWIKKDENTWLRKQESDKGKHENSSCSAGLDPNWEGDNLCEKR